MRRQKKRRFSLDNAAKLYAAVHSERLPMVFRVSAALAAPAHTGHLQPYLLQCCSIRAKVSQVADDIEPYSHSTGVGYAVSCIDDLYQVHCLLEYSTPSSQEQAYVRQSAGLLQSRCRSVVARRLRDEATPKALSSTVEIASPPKAAARNDSCQATMQQPCDLTIATEAARQPRARLRGVFVLWGSSEIRTHMNLPGWRFG